MMAKERKPRPITNEMAHELDYGTDTLRSNQTLRNALTTYGGQYFPDSANMKIQEFYETKGSMSEMVMGAAEKGFIPPKKEGEEEEEEGQKEVERAPAPVFGEPDEPDQAVNPEDPMKPVPNDEE